MNELKKVKVFSIEIGDRCNLSKEHTKCPINARIYDKKYEVLTIERIIKLIDEANEMGFDGYIAFHYYNEPLMYEKKIKKIIEERPNNKYLLWTNGLLLKEKITENEILRMFNKVVITCYDIDKLEFFKNIKNYYKNVQIAMWDLDDRIEVYDKMPNNKMGCERVIFEFPIDYYGNVHLCCEDWNNEYKLGNVMKNTLKEIVQGDLFQQTQKLTFDGKLVENAPLICKKCNRIAIKENFDIDNIKGCI